VSEPDLRMAFGGFVAIIGLSLIVGSFCWSEMVPSAWQPTPNLTQGARLAEGVESSNPRDDEGHR
jgi:hypothetical protein